MDVPGPSIRASEDSPCCFRRLKDGGVRVVWEIISRCNLDCVHCFVDHTASGPSTEEALAVIAEFPLLPVRKVMFTGGEPFLRKDMLTLVEACLDQGVVVDITTNTSLLDDGKIERLAAAGLHEITTSLDGPEAAHDTIRKKPGNFAHVTERVRRLRRAGVTVDIVCVAQKQNAHVVGETIDIARDLGASSITISGFILQGPAWLRAEEVLLAPADEEAVRRQIAAARARHGAAFPIRTVSLFERFRSPVPCPVRDILSIDAHGKVTNCLLAPVPGADKRDLGDGLHAAWRTVNRDWCCSQGGWRPQAATLAPAGA
jgi:MoaA/NifB/PqqE/SkfB family radical SAM enzyme